MDKIKCFLRNLSLRKSIVFYISIFTVIALAFSVGTAALCSYAAEKIRDRYPVSGEKYYLTNEAGERLGEGAYIGEQVINYSPEDERFLTVLDTAPLFTTPVYCALCIMTAAFLFYRNKLKTPISELNTASKKIAENDLDFRVSYQSDDELGELCASYEIMRSTLASNFSSMWRQVEDRKQLNAAFAHDLRTPLTVLKGYDEILGASEDPMVKDTAATMRKHIVRLENYIDSMSKLRRLEDTHPEHEEIELQPYLKALAESSLLLCKQSQKHLRFENNTVSKVLYLDKSFVSQVLDNLVSNAIRYSKQTITITMDESGSGLVLSVSDDGAGFSDELIKRATNPYFTSEANRSEHFGLGLYICKLLCEHHEGYLALENLPDGAKVTAFFKSASL